MLTSTWKRENEVIPLLLHYPSVGNKLSAALLPINDASPQATKCEINVVQSCQQLPVFQSTHFSDTTKASVPIRELLLDVRHDLLAVKASVLDEDFVGVPAGNHDSGKVETGHIAL